MKPFPRHLLDSFKQAFRQDIGYDITDEQAEEYARNVLNLVQTLVNIKMRSDDSDRPRT